MNEYFLKYNEKQHKNELKILGNVYNFDNLEQLLPDDPKCANCGKMATKRCSKCKLEWYCSRNCQLMSWKTHKKLCDLM